MPTASVQAQRFKVLLAGVFSQILCIGIMPHGEIKGAMGKICQDSLLGIL